MKKLDLSRRDVLKTMLWTPPAIMFGAGSTLFAADRIEPLYKPRIVPKGRKVRVAQIGVYNRGAGVLDMVNKFSGTQVEFVAFADVAFTSHDSKRKDFEDVPCYRDYRQMLEEMHSKIDAVIICTPDHSHFPMIMHSMLLGKHVYVEKPMAQNVYECRMIEKLEKTCGVVTQLGNQGHSGHGTIQFGQMVEAGIIKNVKRIDAWMNKGRRWHGWTNTEYPETIPQPGYDWDQWLGRRQFRPHSPKMINGNWRCWYEFGCGCMGDWGAHILDAYHRYLKLGQPYEITTKVTGPSDLYYPQASVITFKFKARGDMPALELNWYDGKGNNAPRPAGYEGGMGAPGSMLYLDNGVVSGRSHGSDYHFHLNDKLVEMEKAKKLPEPGRDNYNHYKNFLNACQGIEKSNSPFSVGAPLSEMLALGCVGQKYGGTLKYDAKNMRITNHKEADAMLRGPEVRDNWNAYDKFRPVKSKVSLVKLPGQAQWTDLVDSSMSKWENPYDFGEYKSKDGVVSLTSAAKKKWFLLTKKEYANFVFEAEIKMPVNIGNSGFMFRCQKKKNKVWGYQAEVDTKARKWSGGLYDEGRRGWFISPIRGDKASEDAFRKRAGECFRQDQWNKYRIECNGSRIKIYVNGILTTDVHDEMDIAGFIGIQHHGEKGLTYQFRKLRVKDLGAGGDVLYPHRENAESGAVASKMKGDIYEAEDVKQSGCKVSKKNKGFQGTGYVQMGGKDSYVEFDNVLGEKTGKYNLKFRYSTSGKNAPCELFINGKSAGKIAFAKTRKASQWKTVDMKVSLIKGGNYIKVVSLGKGPNLDALALTK
ncbi:MAG: DUF1080 domain-containing protein [Planctomycetes bacterium]|nr:DUF1080 domain-containing protein [Planctomycetota bacterium]